MSIHLTESPEIVQRPEQPYVAVRRAVTMTTIGEIADQIPVLIRRLAERGVEPAGPPFLRYLLIDMERELVIEAGVPVGQEVAVDGEVTASVLPAGRYVVTSVLGHPDELVAVTGELLSWARERGLEWDAEPTPKGERWGCRLESFLTDPREQPDMRLWRTELAFRLRD
jgi:effector-binding domain-containing protein